MKKKAATIATSEDEDVTEVVDVAEGTATGNGDDDAEMDEGQVVDLITGDPVKLSPKESVRQEEERKLLEEFGYPEAQKRI
jgi:hypothetical protein